MSARDALLAEVEAALGEADGDLSLLARPLRVVVPSQALRAHLASALVARTGRSGLGVRIDTLDGIAHEVLARAGVAPADEALFPVAVREHARREPALAEDLDRLDDGYASAVATLDDLLDAGFAGVHAEAAAELLLEETSGAARARSNALLRVASALSMELEQGTLGHRSARLARANESLRASAADAALPARRLWIHGFADATGVQLDLLETLAQHCGATVWLDAIARDAVFGRRLRDRLAATGRLRFAEPAPEPDLTALRHGDPEDEARAAAEWALACQERGLAPEEVAIVARDLSRHGLALRRQLRRFGVPFSGAGERGAAGAATRRLLALCELLERGRALPAERWLEAKGTGWSAQERADLRDALHIQGIATVGDLADAEFAAERNSVTLTAPKRLEEDAEGVPRVSRRRVRYERLRAEQALVRGVLRQLVSAPGHARLAERVAHTASLVEALGWSDDTPGRQALADAFPDPERADARPVPLEDWHVLLRRRLEGAGCDAFGGQGGGVQVLTVMEARACRFAALRVIGLNRGVFPRALGEDPLLPDVLRRPLRDVLPDLPVKSEAHEEERFLFRQLLGAAPEVVLSCAASDARGRSAPASPLFDRAGIAAEDAPEPACSSPRDALLEAALAPGRAAFAAALPGALAAGRRGIGLDASDVDAWAATRLAVLSELDPGPRAKTLGPYLGWVGAPVVASDPRRADPYVTALERMAKCPWQAFLQLLRLEAQPDVWGALPAAGEPRAVGNVVHAVLEKACAPGAAWPATVPEAAYLEAAQEQVRKQGIVVPSYARALARRAVAYIAVAQRLAREEDAQVRHVESREKATVNDAEGVPRTVHFLVDLVDEIDGEERSTDWKTGTLAVKNRSSAGREKGYREKLACGELLQGHVYALSGRRARYVYLRPDHEDELRVLPVETGPVASALFDAVIATLFDARDQGAYPPRLRDAAGDEPRQCEICEVKQACQRGDSGARRRLGAWAEEGVLPDASPVEHAALALWRLPEAGGAS